MGAEIDFAANAFLDGLTEPSKSKANKPKKKKKKNKKTGINNSNVAANSSKPDVTNKNKNTSNDKKSTVGKLAALHLQQKKAELEARRQAEAEQRRIEEEERKKEDEIKKLAEEKKRLAREKKKKKKEELRKAGKPVTKAQRARAARAELMRQQLLAQGKFEVTENGELAVKSTKKEPVPKAAAMQVNEKNVSKKIENQAKNKEDDEQVIDSEIKPEAPLETKTMPATNTGESDRPVVSNWEDAFDVDTLKNNIYLVEEEERVKEDDYQVQASKPKKNKPSQNKKESVSSSPDIGKDDSKLRSPICCVMGHVDTGKTKMLDKLRNSNVQDNEAGGITQQIGATFFPIENLKKQLDKMKSSVSFDYKLPGLLMIDTPGHESFSNLRKRGSVLCDIAILIVDLMHGLEQQTIESLNLLRESKTPFIVALNKIDRLYDWQPNKNASFRDTLALQQDTVIMEFENRSKHVITQLMQEGLNSKLYYENNDFKRVVSLVPTSAHTGEGIPDLLLLLIQLSQKLLFDKLTFKKMLQCTVIEVKKIEGVGTTIDVILINGELNEGDEIMVATLTGAVQTQIKALLTPQPMKEIRIKSNYIHHKTIKAAMGVKIVAPGLEEAIAGTQLIRFDSRKDKRKIKTLEAQVMRDYDTIIKSIDQSGTGVCVQASTLGSLEALIAFLRSENIPINHASLGPIHKKDVMRSSVMLESKPEYATILAFDVKVTKDAQELSEDLGVKIFTADIIYHLFDQFTKYMKTVNESNKDKLAGVAVFPCILRIMPEHIFMKKSPLILGVEVVEGILKTGTPIVVPERFVDDPDNPGEKVMLSLGKIQSIEEDKKEKPFVKRGSKVCVKISGNQNESYVQYGRHFDAKNLLYSKLTRDSIDSLKTNFKEDLQKSDWMTVIKLKKVFNIA